MLACSGLTLTDARNLATPTTAPDVDAAEAEGVRRG